MSVSLILEVAISMVFLYLLGSQVVLSIYELWAGYTNTRGKFLYRRLKGAIGDATTVQLYRQQPVVALSPAGQDYPSPQPGGGWVRRLLNRLGWSADNVSIWKWWLGKDGLPAYLSADLFASALLAMIAPAATQRLDLTNALQASGATTNAWYSNEIKELLTQLLNTLDKQAPLADCQKTVARWYDDYGERLTGWYKRRVRCWLFCIGLVVAIGGNIDSPFILRYLWAHPLVSRTIADAAASVEAATDAAALRDQDARARRLALSPAITPPPAATPPPATDSTGAAKAQAKADRQPTAAQPSRATIDSLQAIVRASRAQLLALNDRLRGQGFPIGRTDSLGRDSTELPAKFVVRQPARHARRNGHLEFTPQHYLRYTRVSVNRASQDKNLTYSTIIWHRRVLASFDEKAHEDSLRSQSTEWLVFGPQARDQEYGKLLSCLGWLLTALALSVGAPFWFDLLCRLVNIRNLGIKPPRPGK